MEDTNKPQTDEEIKTALIEEINQELHKCTPEQLATVHAIAKLVFDLADE